MLSFSNLAAAALFSAIALVDPRPPAASPLATLAGRLRVIDRGGRTANDVQLAVIWLTPKTGNAPAVSAARADIITAGRTFSPHITVVPAGSTVRFPNRDGFNHNVFSLSEGNSFDLGLYERGEGKSTVFTNPGVVNVFCNVHSTMSAVVVVRDSPWFAQPSVDGSFSIANIPPGEYVLHLWHERAQQSTQPVTVGTAGRQLPDLQLDARGFRQRQHLNKFGRPYARTGRRY